MRAAIRGDFERLAERRGAQELMRVVPAVVEPAAEVEALHAEPSPRSWLARLLSREAAAQQV